MLNCQMLGIGTMLLATALSALFGVGSAFAGRYKAYSSCFKYLGWPMAAVITGGIWFSFQGMVAAFQSASLGLAAVVLLCSLFCFFWQVTMLVGILLMIGGLRTDGQIIYMRENSIADRILYLRWQDPYINGDNNPQDICSLSRIIAANIAMIPLAIAAFCLFLLIQSLSVFFSGKLCSENDLFPGEGKRVVDIPPALSLLIAAAFSFPVWLLIRHFFYLETQWGATLFIALLASTFVLHFVFHNKVNDKVSNTVSTMRSIEIKAPRPIASAVNETVRAAVDTTWSLYDAFKRFACPVFRLEESE